MFDEYIPTKSECSKVSKDGKWGMINSEGGSGGMLYKLGKYGYEAGSVMDVENFEISIENAKAEVRALAAEFEMYG